MSQINMNEAPLTIRDIHRIIAVLVTEGGVHVEGCQKSGVLHAFHLLDLMKKEPSQVDLRDQFAMAALTGLLADPQVMVEGTAAMAYRAADEMLEARKET